MRRPLFSQVSRQARFIAAGRQFPLNRPSSMHLIPVAGPLAGQRRFLFGGIFRVVRTTAAAGAGAAAGGLAYVNYKVAEAGASAQERIEQTKEWFGDMWDKAMNSLGSGEGSQGSGGEQSSNSGGSSSSGGSGSSGGGNGMDVTAVAAVTAISSSDQEDQMVLLTRKMIEIRNILLQINDADTLKLPSIVVIGSQSSGKSSVLEAIVGHEFLPKGNNMVTRRPIELTLISSPDLAAEYATFPALKLGKITDFKQVQKTLTDLNLAVPEEEIISDDPIQLNIYSPHLPDLTLIDLPGYIQVMAADQPVTLKRKIIDLADKYIQSPNVILAVSAADVDLANSTALKESRRVDPFGKRTIGVITKLDLVDAERGYGLLTNRNYPLKMGYVGVVARTPAHKFLSNNSANFTNTIAETEKSFFQSQQEYASLDVGVIKLRSKLMRVLEQSMADSLRPTTMAIRRELDDSSYQFKVEFNDRVLTPTTYLAQSLDAFKVAFKDLSREFTRDDVKRLVKDNLDQKVLNLLAERYWNSPVEDATPSMVPVSNMSSSRPDALYWQSELDSASATLTKLGVGRMSSLLLVDEIEKRMKKLVSETSFRYHDTTSQAVYDATRHILDERYYATTEQVENAIKPFKYEVEVDDREWARSRDHSYNLLKEELRQCEAAYEKIRQVVGSSKLSQVMGYVEHTRKGSVIDHINFSPVLLQKGREAIFLRDRTDILNMRMAALRSNRCKSRTNKALCPEVFLDVVADKLTSTAVLFLNFELLNDFYYTLPRELDSIFGDLNEHAIEKFAFEDPAIKRHVELQRRKDLLQLALGKIQAVTELHQSSRR